MTLRVSLREVYVETLNGLSIVEGASLDVEAGEVVGIVGESGSGKTTLGVSMLGYARPGTRIASGTIQLEGTNVLALSEAERRLLRGRSIAYVPQDPAAALNPSFRIGAQLREVLRAHDLLDQAHRHRPGEVLEQVQLPSDDAFQRRFPHQLSGGATTASVDRDGSALRAVGTRDG